MEYIGEYNSYNVEDMYWYILIINIYGKNISENEGVEELSPNLLNCPPF